MVNVDHFILDEVEMNPEGLRQLYRQVKTQDTSASCQFEVTDEGESGIRMRYQPTAALSCVTVVGSPSPCVSSCSLYQGRGDSRDQVRTLYTMCIIYLIIGSFSITPKYPSFSFLTK